MSKKGSAPFIKKNFPGLKRISKESGERVWIFEGKEFKTKNDVYLYKYSPKAKAVELPKEPEVEMVKDEA